jgi:putative nucleotidyltransferase-like protein
MNLNILPFKTQIEARFLLDCCVTRPDSERIARIIAMMERGTINWDWVVSTATSNRVLPLLYRTLKTVCAQKVPSPVIEKMRATYLQNAARNLALTYCLVDILNSLDQNGIVAVPFKGPTLAEFYFGELALREFSDLDILIHPDDVAKTFRVLEEHGFHPNVHLNEDQINILMHGEYSLEFNKGASWKGGQIDLHWELTGKFSRCQFGLDRLRPRLHDTEFFGSHIRQMSTEDLLVYLCLHGSKECWHQLSAICCVSELIITQPDLDWNYIFDLAKWARCQRRLHLGLYLANELIGIPLPERIVNRVRGDLAMVNIADDVQSKLFSESKRQDASWVPKSFSTFHLRVSDSNADQIRYVVKSLFRPTRIEWGELPLPAFCHFLHYLYRPFHLIRNTVNNLSRSKRT